jgi:hypothetical protein
MNLMGATPQEEAALPFLSCRLSHLRHQTANTANKPFLLTESLCSDQSQHNPGLGHYISIVAHFPKINPASFIGQTHIRGRKQTQR